MERHQLSCLSGQAISSSKWLLIIFLLIGNFSYAHSRIDLTAGEKIKVSFSDSCDFDIVVTNPSCNPVEDGQIAVELGPNPHNDFVVQLRLSGMTIETKTGLKGDTTVTFINRGAGNYAVRVSSSNLEGGTGCECFLSAVLVSAPGFVIDSIATTDVLCNGGLNGTGQVFVSGALTPLSYEWSNGEMTQTATMLPAGLAVVTVTDANMCEVSQAAQIADQAPISYSITTLNNISCAGLSDGAAFVHNINGGVPPYSVSWNGGMPNDTSFNLPAGSNMVIVTDANGCQKNMEHTILNAQAIQANPQVDSLLCNGDNSGGIIINPTGGTNSFTYLWNTGVTSKDLSGLAADTYSVTITDGNGCTLVSSYTVTEPLVLAVDTIMQTNVNCTGLSLGNATAEISGGTMPYEIEWSNGSMQNTIVQLQPGDYFVTITDFNECIAFDGVSIIMETDPVMTGLENATISNEGTISQTFESMNTFVVFLWEVTSTTNIDTAHPSYESSGSSTDGAFSQSYSLVDRSEPGVVEILAYPRSDDCIGETLTAIFMVNADDIPAYIPDLITPNGDGANDSWQVVLPSGADPSTYTVVIYNRAGGKVYEGNMAQDWEAQNCPDGVYFYRINSSEPDTQIFEGAVTVLRRL